MGILPLPFDLLASRVLSGYEPFAAPEGCRYRPEGWHRHHAPSPAVSRDNFLRNPHFSIVLPFYFSGGIGVYPTWPRPRSRRRQHASDGIQQASFHRRIPPNPSFLFFTPMLIISGSTSQATQRPGPPGRATRRSITRLHWPAASAPLNATSNTTPRRPHRPSSLPYYHRSPFSLLLSGNRT